MRKKLNLKWISCRAQWPAYLAALCLLMVPSLYAADDKTPETDKRVTTQQVGGLLFDVDEGVKIEKGSGGSVYVKSNKEYMQNKFESIEQKLDELEERLSKLEDAKKTEPQKGNEDAKNKVLVS